MKKIIFGLILGIIMTSSILGSIAYATIKLKLEEISYNDSTVKDALDTLYEKSDGFTEVKQFCKLISGEMNTIGSKYECDPGDGIKRKFYLLSIGNTTVDLIMEKNINDGGIDWKSAMQYFKTGAGVQIKNAWTNVSYIDLPKAQAIADATLNTSFIAADLYSNWWCLGSKAQDLNSSPWCMNTEGQQSYSWLFNNLAGCEAVGCTEGGNITSAVGYWTRDVCHSDSAWMIASGAFSYNSISDTTRNGVRPVIIVLKKNLYQ